MSSKKFKPQWTGLNDRKEKDWARKRFKEYGDSAHIDSHSDFELLVELVKREVIQERYWKKIEEIEKKASKIDGSAAIPKGVINSLDDNLEQIIKLKDLIGLGQGDKKKAKFEEIWDSIQRKLQKYSETHRGEFLMKCPHCGKYVQLLRKIKDYDTHDFKMFRDTFLYNETLMKFIDDKILTVDQVAEIWGLELPDYIIGIYEKIYLKEKENKQ